MRDPSLIVGVAGTATPTAADADGRSYLSCTIDNTKRQQRYNVLASRESHSAIEVVQ